jgi:hypothetical protein
MTEAPAPVQAARVPLAAWNAACLAVGGDAGSVPDAAWQQLADAGLASEPGVLDERWADLIARYLATPISLSCVAQYNGLQYRSSIAIGTASVCVLERFKLEQGPDGSWSPTARDADLEVSATLGDPWLLLRRVIPPLAPLQAPAHQTASHNAVPVRVDEALGERIAGIVAERPDANVADVLRREGDAALQELFAADEAGVAYVLIAATPERPLVAQAWYAASQDALFRATFAADPPFEKVRPGDLAFTFLWHLLGAQDALGLTPR